MKNIFVSLFVSLVLITSTHANTMYAVGVGFSVDASSLDVINRATSFYDLTGNTHGANPLPGNLGTINMNTGGLLELAGSTAKTWQANSDSANSVSLFWRVYETGTANANKGSFTTYNLPFGNEWDQEGSRHKYWSANTPVNLLQNVIAGTVQVPKDYTVEMYAVAGYTYSNSGGGSFNSTVNNGGANYVATFNVVPEPSTGMMMGLGIAGLLVVRRFRKKA